MIIKTLLKLFIPPIIIKVIKLFLPSSKRKIDFRKTKLSWDGAFKETNGGYSAEQILIKCRDSLLKVKSDEYPYERDSVLFTEKELFYPLLSSMLYVSLKNNKTLNIVDFGGSLGSTYFQNRDILKQAGITINWNIVEQDNFVKCGKEHFADDELHFFHSIDEVINEKREMSVCLFSGVLQYLKEPYKILDFIAKLNIEYIIIDRTPFLEKQVNDVLSIQTVPPKIYEAAYPHWFFSLDKFNHYVEKNYERIIMKWKSLDQHCLKNYESVGLGFFLKVIPK